MIRSIAKDCSTGSSEVVKVNFAAYLIIPAILMRPVPRRSMMAGSGIGFARVFPASTTTPATANSIMPKITFFIAVLYMVCML